MGVSIIAAAAATVGTATAAVRWYMVSNTTPVLCHIRRSYRPLLQITGWLAGWLAGAALLLTAM
jgi:hypothetical protein